MIVRYCRVHGVDKELNPVIRGKYSWHYWGDYDASDKPYCVSQWLVPGTFFIHCDRMYDDVDYVRGRKEFMEPYDYSSDYDLYKINYWGA